MTTEKQKQKLKEIEDLKKELKNHEYFVTKGKKYIRFIIEKINVPESVRGKYINILYDENNVPHATVTIQVGLDEKAKKEKELERQKQKHIKAQEKENALAEINIYRSELREAMRDKDFDKCKVINEKIAGLEASYRNKFKVIRVSH